MAYRSEFQDSMGRKLIPKKILLIFRDFSNIKFMTLWHKTVINGFKIISNIFFCFLCFCKIGSFICMDEITKLPLQRELYNIISMRKKCRHRFAIYWQIIFLQLKVVLFYAIKISDLIDMTFRQIYDVIVQDIMIFNGQNEYRLMLQHVSLKSQDKIDSLCKTLPLNLYVHYRIRCVK